MKLLARRISDGHMLRLIKMWLETAVEETDEKGNRHRTTRNKDQGMGTPQGAPITPMLSNIYMRRFVKGWKTGGRKRPSAKADGFPDHLARVRIRGQRCPVLRPVYSGPIPDVQGSVEISVRGVT